MCHTCGKSQCECSITRYEHHDHNHNQCGVSCGCKKNKCDKSCKPKMLDSNHAHKGLDVTFCKQMSETERKCFDKYGFAKGMDYDSITLKFISIINQLEGKLKEVLENQRLIDDNSTSGIKKYYILSGGSLPVNSPTITLRQFDYCMETTTGTAAGTVIKTYSYDGMAWKLID
jgi:hypothetical protein